MIKLETIFSVGDRVRRDDGGRNKSQGTVMRVLLHQTEPPKEERYEVRYHVEWDNGVEQLHTALQLRLAKLVLRKEEEARERAWEEMRERN